jgi:hypothetical protein
MWRLKLPQVYQFSKSQGPQIVTDPGFIICIDVPLSRPGGDSFDPKSKQTPDQLFVAERSFLAISRSNFPHPSKKSKTSAALPNPIGCS